MTLRLKTTLLIVLVVFATTVSTFLSGLYFINSSLDKTIEQDMEFAIGIADNLVGTKMIEMKSEAITIASRLELATTPEVLEKALREQFALNEGVSALTIIDHEANTLARYSEPPHDHDLSSHLGYMDRVFEGSSIITSPFYCEENGEFVMNVYTPMSGDRVLAVSVSGLTFTDLLSGHKLWQTGNIFMLNEVGTVIGSPDEELVLALSNYVEHDENYTTENQRAVGGLVETILSSDHGVTSYMLDGAEQLCAYSRIDSSALGWRVAVSVPLSESPQAEALNGQLLASLFFLIIGAIAAFFLSKIMSQPFKEIEDQKTELKRVNNAKSDFLAHMSHEIRTPLNAVVGLSELMLDDEQIKGEAEDRLEKIHGSGMTILSIVNDILDISKVESGKFELNSVRYDIPSLINDTVTLNIVRIGEKAISFKVVVDEKLPAALFGDDLRIKQIFNNLLSNAFKYTHSGEVEWYISFEKDDESDDIWLTSRVSDTGIGIKPEDQKRLFSAYSQVDAKSNREVEGTGLGLSITKHLVEMMEGSVSATSIYGAGSIFSFRIRQSIADSTPIGEEIAKNLMDMRYALFKRKRNTGRKRIDLSYASVLVVDDIETNLDVVKGMLKPYGLKIDCVMSGQAAINAVQKKEPLYSAIFMDHMMPEMDGIEAVRIIRKDLGTSYAQNIPIIALTANALAGNEEMFLSKGFQDFIPKPIDITKLDIVLRRWVRDKDKELSIRAPRSLKKGSRSTRLIDENQYSLPEKIAIDGIDVTEALQSFDGSMSALIDVLVSYTKNTPPLLKKLEENLEKKNLYDYAIVVHGIKGSSYGLHAREVGKKAEVLEHAAQAEDLVQVQTNHDDFIKATKTLLKSISSVLKGIAALQEKPLRDEPDPSLLEKLRTASKAFDMDGVDSAMEALEAVNYKEGQELVVWLRRQVDAMAFEEIAKDEWSIE